MDPFSYNGSDFMNDNTNNFFKDNTNKNYYFFRKYRRKTFFRQNETKENSNVENETNIEPKIVDLSMHNLNKYQINLLNLSLKFCPTPGRNIELKKDLKKFEREFGLLEKFRGRGDTDDSPVENKTKFFPDEKQQ